MWAGVVHGAWLTACVIACESGASAASIWRRHIVWLSVNFLAGASIAMLLSVNMRQVSFQGLLLILPLVFLLYLVFRTWTDRVREADSHVAAINRLYLSTVEALAVAIESKDQVTHNHVRRVQTLSMIIAGQLGINDESELRAIEAGALLHDTGKVAVPDYLLNKPGKLTPDEYELIKLHAPIGAEILKAVDFPYAVVPIVRHHHENWDGTGYPDGIKGEAIPIGARIISVVDCFDALTSDRPYRRALSDEDAIAIIQERRGTMYAPPVVDALASCYQEIRPTLRAFEQEAPSDASLLMARFHQRPVSPADSARTGDQTQRTNASDASRSSGSQPGENPTSSSALDAIGAVLQVGVWTDEERASIAVPAVVAVLRTVTPATTVCVSRVNTRKQSVEIVHVAGHGEQLLRGGSIRLGEGITGWVAAHGIGVINSDPALDFPLQFATLTPRLSATLALPIGDARVLTLYTDRPAGFEPAHRAAAERIAERLGSLLVSTANSDSLDDLHQRTLQQRRDQGVGLAALLVASIRADQSCAVLSVASSADRSGVRADVMALVALVLPTVRLSDGVIASAHDEVVAVLPGCEPEAEGLVLSRLQSALDAWHEDLGELMVGFAVASQHEGPGFAVGLQIARDRRRPLRRSVEQPVCEAMALANGRRS